MNEMPAEEHLPNTDVVRYYAMQEIEPLRGSLSLYEKVLAVINDRWSTENVPDLQREAYGIVPEAILFRIWDVLRAAQRDEDSALTAREYIHQTHGALKAIMAGQYQPEDVERVESLGTTPARVTKNYVALLKKVS